MAVVSGQSFFSVVEGAHDMAAAIQPSSSDSDDEYDYVSSLAEQIAHAMLDEGDEESVCFAKQDNMWASHGAFWPDSRVKDAEEANYINARVVPSNAKTMVSHPRLYAEGHLGCVEGSLNEASAPLQAGLEYLYRHNNHTVHRKAAHHHSYYTQDVQAVPCEDFISRDLHECSMYRGWNRSRVFNRKPLAVTSSCSRACPLEEETFEAWKLPPFEAHTAPYSHVAFRKETIGTGVFLPRINNLGTQPWRKSDLGGFASSKVKKSKCKVGSLPYESYPF